MKDLRFSLLDRRHALSFFALANQDQFLTVVTGIYWTAKALLPTPIGPTGCKMRWGNPAVEKAPTPSISTGAETISAPALFYVDAES